MLNGVVLLLVLVVYIATFNLILYMHANCCCCSLAIALTLTSCSLASQPTLLLAGRTDQLHASLECLNYSACQSPYSKHQSIYPSNSQRSWAREKFIYRMHPGQYYQRSFIYSDSTATDPLLNCQGGQFNEKKNARHYQFFFTPTIRSP